MGNVTPEPNAAATEQHPAWRRVQLARHPKRPHSLDYISRLIADFEEIHGDRGFADDAAIVAGFGAFEGRPVMVVAEQKGRDTKQKLYRNFGMPKPEGYRKALRIMQIAAKFGRPVITLLDTPGAYPGVSGEDRGISQAIALNMKEFSVLPVPIIATILGEGGSGGAIGIGYGHPPDFRPLAFSCRATTWARASSCPAKFPSEEGSEG